MVASAMPKNSATPAVSAAQIFCVAKVRAEDTEGLDAETLLDLAGIPRGALQGVGQRAFLAGIEGEPVALRSGGDAALAA
jgi:hypothetical protein